MNDFAAWTQWIPVAFSALAIPLIAIAWWAEFHDKRAGRWLALFVGATSVAVGVGGMALHLVDHFFLEQTIRNLVYTAPFAAPLAYAGVGLLLILGRTRVDGERERAQWVLVLALGGFVGTFVMALADHAQNGFFVVTEWIPVGAGALAIGFLVPSLGDRVTVPQLRLCAWVMGLEVAVGLLGFALHLLADVRGPSASLADNLRFGAPPFAPLLFANMALLAWLGLWSLARAEAERDLPANAATP